MKGGTFTLTIPNNTKYSLKVLSLQEISNSAPRSYKPIHTYFNHFRRHIVRRTTETVRRSIQIDLKFAHAKVSDSHVSIKVQQNVVQFKVSVEANIWILFNGILVRN